MNKKTSLAFLVLGLGIFMFSGCSLSAPSARKVAPTPVPKSSKPPSFFVGEPAPETPPVVSEPIPTSTVSSSSQVIREYKEGVDYVLNYPKDYFVETPKVSEITCDFAKECPCVYDPQYLDEKDFCQRLAKPERQEKFCVQKWSEGAAGSVYTTYVYTTGLASSSKACASLQFTTRLVNDCQVYEGNDANIKKCEAEKAAEPGIIKNVVSSFEMKLFKNLLDATWKSCINQALGLEVKYPSQWESCAAAENGFKFKTDYKPYDVYAVASVEINPGDAKDIISDYGKPAAERQNYFEKIGRGAAFKEFGFGGPLERNGVILGEDLYRFIWEAESNQKCEKDCGGVWTPNYGFTKDELFNVVKSTEQTDK
jgi:hypothetical protein